MGNDTQTRQPDSRTRSGRAAHRDAEGVTGGPASQITRLTAGGTDGNERLTVLTGLLLIVMFAVLGVTIVRIGQLLWLHLFLGLLLLGPVALKMLSTGYRFARYYTSAPAYRRKGPPAPWLRLLGPLVVLSTLAVFATGVALLLLGPSSRQPLALLHKVAFFAWIAVVALHVLGHLPEIERLLKRSSTSRRQIIAMSMPAPTRAPRRVGASAGLPGGGGRAASLLAALLVGLVVAVALLPQFAAWTH
jgi:hypothetical protein